MTIESKIVDLVSKTNKIRFIHKSDMINFLASHNIDVNKSISKIELNSKMIDYFSENTLMLFNDIPMFGLTQTEVLELVNVTKTVLCNITKYLNVNYEIRSIGNNKFIYQYKISDVIAIDKYAEENNLKRKPKKDVILPELTDENIAEALYVINKSAKLSRDTKMNAYYQNKYIICRIAKIRELTLYDLKNLVMDKLIKEDRITFVGYHKQKFNFEEVWLEYYKLAGYSFHKICSIKPKNISNNEVKEINDLITSERKISTKMKFNVACKLLEEYVLLNQ